MQLAKQHLNFSQYINSIDILSLNFSRTALHKQCFLYKYRQYAHKQGSREDTTEITTPLDNIQTLINRTDYTQFKHSDSSPTIEATY